MGKKIITYISLLAILTMVLLPFGPRSASASIKVAAGSLIKGESLSSVYYLGEDNKRYIFPNDRVYFSWHDNFNQVQEVSDSQLADYQLGGNVQYKPGAYLVKIQTDPKVYAVGEKGQLRWIETEQLARSLYGANWNLLVDDIPDSFFFNYKVGAPIDDEDEYDPDEEDQQISSISENLGLKLSKKIARIVTEEHNKSCNRLENTIAKLQKKARHFGIKLTAIGSDYLAQCVDKSFDKKISICHVPPGNTSASTTLIVSKSAAEAHLAHGDVLGMCTISSRDKTAPVIANLVASAATTTATITWSTNEKATSIVELATSTLASSTTITSYIDNTLVTSHSMSLTALAPGTNYYYRVKSADGSGNTATSADLSFATLSGNAADTGAPVISALTVITSTSTATVSWTTNEASDSKVQYATSSLSATTAIFSAATSSLVALHLLNLSDLTPGTTYHYRVISKDSSNNTATSTEQTFATIAVSVPDTLAPVISSISVDPGSTIATIRWTTNEPSSSEVIYARESLATATSTGSETNPNLVTNHLLVPSELNASTTYYFIIKSIDASSNVATTSEGSFTTLSL